MRVLFIAVKLDSATKGRLQDIMDTVNRGISNSSGGEEDWDYQIEEVEEAMLAELPNGKIVEM